MKKSFFLTPPESVSGTKKPLKRREGAAAFFRVVARFCAFAAIVTLSLSLGEPPRAALGSLSEEDVAAGRARILAYLLRQNLPQHHFSHKTLDDALSRTAFELYLNQLDNQKRFLLQDDVERLKAFESRIDDEISQSDLRLPVTARAVLHERVAWVRKTADELLDTGFDLKKHEFLLTDTDKLDYCRTEAELRDRWRKILKLQVINRLLSLEEEAAAGDAEEVPAEKKMEKKGESTPDDLLQKATDKVRANFDDYFSRLLSETVKDQYDRYFDAVARAYDPHTSYMPPATKEDFDISLRGSLEGIGATLRQEDGYVKVVRVIPGSAAYRQGELEAEDVILKVGEGSAEPVEITDMPLRKAVGLIRGKKGSEVRLTVKKADGSIQVIPIVRDVVEIEETFVKSTILTDPASKAAVGYIKIPSFYRDFDSMSHESTGRNSTDDVRLAIKGMKDKAIEGVVLDLRNNGGGALMDAISITGLFIDKGPVVQVKDSTGVIRIKEDHEPGLVYDGPLIVLINRFSASASEILAGALQDYGRAVLVGSSHTHGKGTVQTMLDLNDGAPFPNMDTYRPLGAFKITIQKFYRVSGESTQYRGVLPDIVLPDVMEYMETGERYLDNSLPWDTVSQASFVPWRGPGVDETSLVTRSATRVKSNDEFSRISAQALKSKERRERTLQSLHIDTIRQEREDSRQEREEAGGSLAGHGERSREKDNGKLTEAEKNRLWVESLTEDPYVVEALAVLRDFVTSSETVLLQGSVPTSTVH